jgi:hypothetical protein
MATITPTALLIRSANTTDFTSELNSEFLSLKVTKAIANKVTPKKRVINISASLDSTPYDDAIVVGIKRVTNPKNPATIALIRNTVLSDIVFPPC